MAIGIIIVRTFVLIGFEQIYFDVVLEFIQQGKSWSDRGIEMLVKSDTFAKSIVGAIIGGLIGLMVLPKLLSKKIDLKNT
ncbi:hypothetical protein [Abyssogena phaseoliformis symbiont]|uniref:hypothetical protein n=1 Tax=Abyssogena phaseoliformis symbiont TaxID=596095 RepID=UPI0019153B71|nr:hypothetical protein [Abyssogena phaseoliformis symbiont]